MEKNTEYGAMAILSTSSYGNPNIIANGDTTTGNKTGIVINFNNEWVSAKSERNAGININIADRYVNMYEFGDAYKQKVGVLQLKLSCGTVLKLHYILALEIMAGENGNKKSIQLLYSIMMDQQKDIKIM